MELAGVQEVLRPSGLTFTPEEAIGGRPVNLRRGACENEITAGTGDLGVLRIVLCSQRRRMCWT